jgi:hypothetical protein
VEGWAVGWVAVAPAGVSAVAMAVAAVEVDKEVWAAAREMAVAVMWVQEQSEGAARLVVLAVPQAAVVAAGTGKGQDP